MLFSADKPQVDIREQNALSLAFVGDGVLELLVRERLVSRSRMQPGKLHAAAVRYVSARSQFQEVKLLMPHLTEAEIAVLHRGKNATKATVAKHATAEEYRTSTGFEALLGWLYLRGENERIKELFEILWEGFDPDCIGKE